MGTSRLQKKLEADVPRTANTGELRNGLKRRLGPDNDGSTKRKRVDSPMQKTLGLSRSNTAVKLEPANEIDWTLAVGSQRSGPFVDDSDDEEDSNLFASEKAPASRVNLNSATLTDVRKSREEQKSKSAEMRASTLAKKQNSNAAASTPGAHVSLTTRSTQPACSLEFVDLTQHDDDDDNAKERNSDEDTGLKRPNTKISPYLATSPRSTAEQTPDGPTDIHKSPPVQFATENELQVAKSQPAVSSERPASATTETSAQATGERLTTGGKSVSWTAMMHYLSHIDAENEDEAPKQVPEDDDGEYGHFAYRVVCQKFTLDDLEEIEKDEEYRDQIDIEEYEEVFDTLAEANAFATVEAAGIRKRTSAWTFGRRILIQDELEDGRVWCRFEHPEYGAFEIWVEKHRVVVEKPSRPIPAALAKVHFLVKQKVTTRTGGDGMFENAMNHIHESILNDDTWTSLDLANGEACRHFVELTYRPTSANLSLIAAEKQEEVAYLADMIVGDDMFDREVALDNGSKTIRVWVTSGRTRGPRNN